MHLAIMPLTLGVIWGWVAASVGAGSVPVLIHLLNRFRFRRVTWAAMEFLLRALEKNRRRLKTENLLLLIVRVLLVMLFALALANITFSCGQTPGLFAGNRLRVIIIDDSFSMSYDLGRGETRFRRSRDMAKALLDGLGTRDQAFLIRANSEVEPLQDSPVSQKQTLMKLLNDLQRSTHRGTNLAAALDRALEVCNENTEARCEIVVLSDQQRTGWFSDSTFRSSDATVKAQQMQGVPVYLWGMSREKDLPTPTNVAVHNFRLGGTQLVATGTVTEFEATVVAYGDASPGDVLVHLEVEGETAQTRTLKQLKPNTPQKVPFTYTFNRQGQFRVRVRATAEADFLTLDNTAHMVVPVTQGSPLLIVDGSDDGHAADYLSALFDPQDEAEFGVDGERITPYQTTVIGADKLEQTNLTNYQVVFLCDVQSISDDKLAAVRSYVEGGGQLFVLPGDNALVDWYNQVFYNQGKGLLPAKIGAPTVPAGGTDNDDGQRMTYLQGNETLDHPTLRQVKALGWKWTATVVLKYTPLELPDNPERTDVLATLGGEASRPAIVQKQFGKEGRGNVFLFAVPYNGRWSNMPREIVIGPMLMYMLVEQVVEPPVRRYNLVLDEPYRREYTVEEFDQAITLIDPLTDSKSIRPTRQGATYLLDYDDTEWAGVYEVKRLSGQPPDYFAVTLPDTESDLMRVRPTELEEALQGLDLVFAPTRDDLFKSVQGAGQSAALFEEIFVAILLLAILESFLAWRFGRYK